MSLVRRGLAYLFVLPADAGGGRRPVSAAQSAAFEGKRIVDIQFEPAEQPLEAGESERASCP